MGKFLSDKKRRIVVAVVLCIIIAAGIVVGTMLNKDSTYSCGIKALYKKTGSFNEFTDTFSREFLLRNPEYLNIAGKFDEDYKTIFTNTFMDFNNQSFDIYRKYLEDIKGFESMGLDENEKMTLDCIKWYLEDYMEGKKYKELKWSVNPVDGVQNTVNTYLIDVFKVNNTKDAEDYIDILSSYGTIFDNAMDKMKDSGSALPNGIIDSTISQMTIFLSSDPKGCTLYNDFTGKVLKIKGIDTNVKQGLFKKAENEIEKTVYPAYKRLLAFLEKQKSTAPDNLQVNTKQWKDYYSYSLKRCTTMDLDPGQIHEMALKRVEELKKDFEKTYMQMMGIDTGITGVMTNFNIEDRIGAIYLGITGEDEILNYYRTKIEDARECAAGMFSYVPDESIKVRMLSPDSMRYMEDKYMPSSVDKGKRAELYVNRPQYSTVEPRKIVLSVLRGTYPGHHMQQTIQEEIKGAPLFRRIYNFDGYYNGWGYYAERIAFENELFKPEYTRDSKDAYLARLAYIQSQLFYAAMAAADTGINYRGWSRDRAYGYVSQNSGMVISTEINKCFTNPGSGCTAYIAGLKFIELRDKAEKELGNKFDIKEFHDVILRNGSIPMVMLEEQVQKYIESKR